MNPGALNTDERTKVEAGPGGICRAREDTLVKVRKLKSQKCYLYKRKNKVYKESFENISNPKETEAEI